MFGIQMKFQQSEVRPVQGNPYGQWEVIVGREQYGIYNDLAQALKIAKEFDGTLLD